MSDLSSWSFVNHSSMIHASLKSKWDEDICVMVNVDNDKWNYLCDCGTASLLTPGECIKVKGIFISHTHIDHFANFDTILRHQLGSGKHVVICGPAGMSVNVLGKIRGYHWNLIEKGAVTYEIREINSEGHITHFLLEPPEWKLVKTGNSDGDIIFDTPDFFVKYTLLDHGIPSVAFRFEEVPKLKIGDFPYEPGPWISILKKAYKNNLPDMEIFIGEETFRAEDLFKFLYIKKGFSFGYVMDHLSSPRNHRKIIDLFSEVDLLYIEAYYRNIDIEFAKKNFHSTAKSSGEVARNAKAKKVLFVHHSRRYSKELEDLLEEARAAYDGRKPEFKEDPIARY